ncbi:hypothetical protein [Roseibium sp. M-1]
MSEKQAVIVIHGMGEQRPMGTLRSFVESVWVKDREQGFRGAENEYWIKPDGRVGLKELSRITTPSNHKGVRTDFYEFYWADIMQGTTWQHLSSWLKGLLLRSPASVPWNVYPVWVVLWILSIVIVLMGLTSIDKLAPEIVQQCKSATLFCKYLFSDSPFSKGLDGNKKLVLGAFLTVVTFFLVRPKSFTHLRTWFALPIFAVVLFLFIQVADLILKAEMLGMVLSSAGVVLLHSFLVPYFGDVARYVEASPANIERRQAVRERGLQLLRDLHQDDDYERIIIVSHSLGTIIAYDLLNLFWAEAGPNKHNPYSREAEKAFAELDKWLNDTGDSELDLEKFRQNQRKISLALSAKDNQAEPGQKVIWRISDFVTLGSPLTHAEFLLSRDEEGFKKLCQERVVSQCPPLQEPDTRRNRNTFMFTPPETDRFFPNHAAVFSAVRWTNIYDQHNWILFLLGDVISGSVTENFGDGIREDKVRIQRGSLNLPHFFTHTKYWDWQDDWDKSTKLPKHMVSLREAVNLLDD